MKVAQKIQEEIKRIPTGITFQYDHLNIEPGEHNTAAKALERLCKKGIIKKFSKGKYYKPQQTVFGELGPAQDHILKTYLFEGKKRIAYVTGTALYNRLHLTTQVPCKIKIASYSKRVSINAGGLVATPVKSYVEVNNANFQLLGLLDAIKDFNNIPDTNPSTLLKMIEGRLGELNKKQQVLIEAIALKYPPRVRALLGALLENISADCPVEALYNSLNPLSLFRYHVDLSFLPNARKWYIKTTH